MKNPTLRERKHYAKLIGRTIVGVQWEVANGRALPVLLLSGIDRFGDVPNVAVLADPEGNGPGHLEHDL